LFTLFGCNDIDLKENVKYYKSGKIKERFYTDKNQHRQGFSYDYYENGRIKEIRKFYNGKSNGKCLNFYQNGKLKAKGKFLNNVQIDTTFNYLDNGHLDVIVIYDKKSNPIKEISYFSNGKVHNVRSYYVDGSGQISALKAYFENGLLNEAESDFARLKLTGKNKDSLSVKLYNCQYTDSIYVNFIKGFNYQYSFEAEIIRTLKFSKTTDLNFNLLESDFVKGKVKVFGKGGKYLGEYDESELN
jgi:antitoxin component YwqK of YwqJK toxin-antitoxin module